MKKLFLIALVLFFGPAVFAQDTASLEVAVDYSFLHTPENSFVPSFSSNGAGASVAYFFNKRIGVKADFQDYGTHSLNFSVPGATTGCISQSDCPLSVAGNLFTYTVGPIVRFRVKRVQTFVEVMFGGAHDNAYASLYKACYNQGSCINLSKMPNNNAFNFIIGGGLDIPFKEHISIRPLEVNYEPTRFGNSLKPNDGHANIQNNLRYQAGIVLKF
ncbi:MAG: hypothetical protein WA211_00645 [Candidatus Acidiferrales bacterium]